MVECAWASRHELTNVSRCPEGRKKKKFTNKRKREREDCATYDDRNSIIFFKDSRVSSKLYLLKDLFSMVFLKKQIVLFAFLISNIIFLHVYHQAMRNSDSTNMMQGLFFFFTCVYCIYCVLKIQEGMIKRKD